MLKIQQKSPEPEGTNEEADLGGSRRLENSKISGWKERGTGVKKETPTPGFLLGGAGR